MLIYSCSISVFREGGFDESENLCVMQMLYELRDKNMVEEFEKKRWIRVQKQKTPPKMEKPKVRPDVAPKPSNYRASQAMSQTDDVGYDDAEELDVDEPIIDAAKVHSKSIPVS